MPKLSAGILPYRKKHGRLEVLLVHPGGPFFARRDAGAWSIAKGEYDSGEDALAAARREFLEETGQQPDGPFVPLGQRRQPSGKLVDVWATELDFDADRLVSNTFSLEWPKGSGRVHHYPEVDRAEWFALPEAWHRIASGQRGFLSELYEKLTGKPLITPVEAD